MVLIDGKKFDPAKAEVIFSDGKFSDDRECFYLTKSGVIVKHSYSLWQGSEDSWKTVSRESFIEYMHNHWHQERAEMALELIGEPVDEL